VALKIRMQEYFQDLISQNGYKCEVLARGKNDPGYFVVPGIAENMLNVTNISKKSRCLLIDNVSIVLEGISMLHVIDGSLHIKELKTMKGIYYPRVFYAQTKLEYLLKYYFPNTGFPDLWIYTLPFHHESWGNAVNKIRIDLHYMLDMLDIYLPNTTTVVFVADARECSDMKPPEVDQDFRLFWNTSRNERLHELNQVLYEVLWQKTRHTKNLYGFLDADAISCPIECSWHLNGGHMVDEWYIKMARYILEAFCEDT
jgi:hypothetical protein